MLSYSILHSPWFSALAQQLVHCSTPRLYGVDERVKKVYSVMTELLQGC